MHRLASLSLSDVTTRACCAYGMKSLLFPGGVVVVSGRGDIFRLRSDVFSMLYETGYLLRLRKRKNIVFDEKCRDHAALLVNVCVGCCI